MSSLIEIYRARAAKGHLERDPAQEEALPLLDDLRHRLENTAPPRGFSLFRRTPEPVRGLYLWGGVGRGKSMLMDLFFANVAIEGKRRVHFHSFMQEVHAAMHAARQQGVDDAIRPVADALAQELRLLCLDEMQITDITDAMIVGRLFERLFASGVAVVTTSNRVPDDLYKDGLNRQLFLPFIDLLKERMCIHQLQSPRDYRLDRLAGERRYFTPDDAAARRVLDAVWEDLTGGASEPLNLRVNGREVVLPCYRNGIARASFWELCGQPLGPADYLAIADALRVLLIEGIPCLGRTNFNEARRFVTLVDALYEARVVLIATAAATPQQLYLEGEGSFEFERTASRLLEMQAGSWAAEAEAD